MTKRPRALEPIPVEKLAVMGTRQLLALRARLLRLEECPESSDLDPDEINPAVIQFKSDPRWSQTHAALKEILAGREHVPGGAQRADQRRVRGRQRGVRTSSAGRNE